MRASRVSMRYLKYSAVVVLAAVLLIALLSSCQAPAPQNLPPNVELKLSKSLVQPGENLTIKIKATDPNSDKLSYEIYVNDKKEKEGSINPEDLGSWVDIDWTAPNEEGSYKIKVVVSDGQAKSSDEADLEVDTPPTVTIDSITPAEPKIKSGQSVEVTVQFTVKDNRDSSPTIEVEFAGQPVPKNEINSLGDGKYEVKFDISEYGAYTLVIKATDFNGLEGKVVKKIIVTVEGNLEVEVTPEPTKEEGGKKVLFMGNEISALNFAVYYTPETGAIVDKGAWELENEEVVASDTFNLTKPADYYTGNVEIKRTDFPPDLPAGKYNLKLEILDKDGKVLAYEEFVLYYYPNVTLSVSLSAEATNNDLRSDVYDGSKPIKFYLVVSNSAGATTTLLGDLENIEFAINSKSYTLKNIAFTEDSTEEEIGDGIYYVELPATITFEVTVGATEIDSPSAEATVALADGTKVTSASYDFGGKKIDGKEPKAEFSAEIISNSQIKLSYDIDDANFKVATVVFYGEGETEIASWNTTNVGMGFVPVDVAAKIDQTNVTFYYEAVDELGHEATGTGALVGQVDTAVGSVDVYWDNESWIEAEGYKFYKDSTALDLVVKVFDKSGVYANDINVDLSGISGLSSFATDSEFDGSDLKYTVTLEFASPNTVWIDASSISITVKDVHGNDYILNVDANEILFPDATVIYDTQAPAISNATFTSKGEVTLDIEENGVLSKITVYASDSSAATELAEITKDSWTASGNEYTFTITKEMFEDAELAVPNGENWSLKFVAEDAAGNVSAAASNTGKIDLLPPKLSGAIDAVKYIKRDATSVTYRLTTDNETSKIVTIQITGAEVNDLKVTIERLGGADLTETDAFISGNDMFFNDVNATDATLTITFKSGASIDENAGDSFMIKVIGDDGTYPNTLMATSTVDYSDLFPTADDILNAKIVLTSNSSVVIFKVPSGFTFLDADGAASSNAYGDGVYTVWDTAGKATITEATVMFNSIKLAFKADNSTSWNVIGYDIVKGGLTAQTLEEYVGDVFVPDNVSDPNALIGAGPYYWNLKNATQLVISLPVKDGLYWNNLTTLLNTVGTFSEATKAVATITYDGTTLDSGVYDAGLGAATALAYIAKNTGEGKNITILNIYAKELMDMFAPKVNTVSVASESGGAATSATFTIVFEFPNLVGNVNELLTGIATNTGITYEDDGGNSGITLTKATIAASNSTSVTIDFWFDLSSSNNAPSGVATITIVKDNLTFTWKYNGATFGVTNFESVIKENAQ